MAIHHNYKINNVKRTFEHIYYIVLYSVLTFILLTIPVLLVCGIKMDVERFQIVSDNIFGFLDKFRTYWVLLVIYATVTSIINATTHKKPVVEPKKK